MRFNAAAFDTFLTGIGQTVKWRRAYACPCVSPHSGQPNPKHALCQGKGRLWNPAVETVTGIASQKVQAEWQASGQYENGDLVLTIPQVSPLWDAGPFDRVLMMNSTTTFSMPLAHGEPSERLLFSVASLQRCFWIHPQNASQIVEGVVPAVDANGNLSWAGGAGEPPPGAIYSLSGTKFDEYFVFTNLPSDRNQHQGLRLPKKAIARKWDLFGR